MAISTAILEPVVVLLLLNCIVLLWMFCTRIPAIIKMGLTLDPNAPRGSQMQQLPPKVRWKSDNYSHLLEQPVLFYAVAFTLALLGQGDGVNLTLAWCYVILRAAHTLVQTTWNKVEVRFALFAVSSLVLIALIIRAAVIVWR